MFALLGPEEWDFLKPSRSSGEPGRLGPYRLLEVLGVGGMGLVFRAEDTQLGRPVALKVLRPSLAACAAARERFLREARVAAAVQHDHVVSIWHVGEDRGAPFIAMPLLQGESLDRRLEREGRLPLAEVLRIGREACRGLAAAHARGLVHCDIKPANIWLEGVEGRVKLFDFGLARAAGEAMDWTSQDTSGGTPSCMAPEQSRGSGLDGRADLFSLGCVLYHLATGEQPFQGSDAMATLIAAAVDPPAPPLERNPELPPALSELILRLLAKDPAQRPPSADAVAAELEAIESQKRARGGAPRDPGDRVRRRWLSSMTAAAALLLVPGPLGPARPGPAPPLPAPPRAAAARSAILPAAAVVEPRVDPPTGTVCRRTEESSAVAAVERQRNAVGLEILRVQVDLEALDRRLEKEQDPALLQSAVAADEEAAALRARIGTARAILDDYRSRGYSPSLPTPAAAARRVAELEARLDERIKKIEEDLHGRAGGRQELEQARLHQVRRIEALRKVYDGLQADLDRLNGRKPPGPSLLPGGVVRSR